MKPKLEEFVLRDTPSLCWASALACFPGREGDSCVLGRGVPCRPVGPPGVFRLRCCLQGGLGACDNGKDSWRTRHHG